MKLVSFVVSLVVVVGLLSGGMVLMSGAAEYSHSSSAEITETEAKLSEITSEFQEETQGLNEKMESIKSEMQSNNLFSIFQIAPSLLDVFLNSFAFIIKAPGMVIDAVAVSIPEIPSFIIWTVTILFTLIIIFKIAFTIRGTPEV